MAREHPCLTKLRKLAATFPETKEVETWDHPTFRVRDKIFASFEDHEGRPSICVKQSRAEQAVLIEHPGFFVPSYVGQHGWVGFWVDDVEWPMIADLVESSYRKLALKRMVRELDASRA